MRCLLLFSLVEVIALLTPAAGAQMRLIAPAGFSAELPKIKIGGVQVKNMDFGLLDLSGVNEAYASAGMDPINIIIGGDILLKYHCVIDYELKEFLIGEK